MKTQLRIIAVASLLSFLTVVALAHQTQDDKREAQLRTVRGQVMDKSDAPVISAVVYLRNTRNNDVRTSFSDETGNYRFSGLDPNIDYEIHAEKESATSANHGISSFDAKKEIIINLKINKKKS